MAQKRTADVNVNSNYIIVRCQFLLIVCWYAVILSAGEGSYVVWSQHPLLDLKVIPSDGDSPDVLLLTVQVGSEVHLCGNMACERVGAGVFQRSCYCTNHHG